jgi:uncharacterized protein
MQRLYFDQLLAWKNGKHRKPLLLQGARQVGKTWLMKEFGKKHFKSVAYLNFDKSERLKSLFTTDFNIDRIVAVIELECNISVVPEQTLIIFDEIQEAANGLTVLKYFQEDAPQYHVIAAGSLLGIAINPKQSFPVGKVDFLKIHPLTFEEFLLNANQEKLLLQLRNNNWQVLETFHEKLKNLLRQYYFLGGMPEVLNRFFKNEDYNEAREVQFKILEGYENDFAKHAPINLVPRIRLVWKALLTQLAKENKKFIYGQVKKGSRANEFEMAICWLIDAGLITKVNRITKPTLPLSSYGELDAFKLFLLDIGLLNAMAGIDASILLEKNAILTEFKGALTEQYVCQQLSPKHSLYYWTNEKGMAEVDFIFQSQYKVIPLEVKAEENVKAKSLKLFSDTYKITPAYRVSMNAFRHQDWMTNVPLYGIGFVEL